MLRLARRPENAKLLKLQQNASIEGFKGRLRDEVLNETLFSSLDHACMPPADWQRDYNTVRSHSAIGNKAPISLLNGSSAPPPA
jgi:putative transposase